MTGIKALFFGGSALAGGVGVFCLALAGGSPACGVSIATFGFLLAGMEEAFAGSGAGTGAGVLS
jgi:hypothetical protein